MPGCQNNVKGPEVNRIGELGPFAEGERMEGHLRGRGGHRGDGEGLGACPPGVLLVQGGGWGLEPVPIRFTTVPSGSLPSAIEADLPQVIFGGAAEAPAHQREEGLP